MRSSKHSLFGVFLLLTVQSLGCKRDASPPTSLNAAEVPSVLLITLDTTRADRIGCYGYLKAQTPALDGLARSGVLFQHAYCQVPLTLPSHSSLLTGTYPATNGVRINGMALTDSGVATLAELFHQKGYRTGAFVSALPLDSQFGLGRGFDTYDDNLGTTEAIERSANRVCDSALTWLAESKATPFFAWVHLFDAHSPYAPPEPYRNQLADPYDGEIAFADSQILRLLNWLDANGLRKRTLIVVAGDHGEAFEEHDETEHGLFVYTTTMQVPLILSFPTSVSGGQVVKNAVGLVDVFPTIIELLGWDQPEGLEGRSLAAVCRGEEIAPRPVYGESMYPHLGFGWAPLRSLTTERWKYIDAPMAELYDLLADPREQANVNAEHASLGSRMRDDLLAMTEQMVARTAPAVADSEMLSRLEGLGYVGGSSRTIDPSAESSGRDPKEMVGAYQGHSKAVGLLLKERFHEVIPIMETLVKQSPESDEFFNTLGKAYQGLGRYVEAQKAFESSLRVIPDNPRRLWRLGESLLRQNKLEDARVALSAALEIAPNLAQAHCSLGDLLGRQGKPLEAMKHYQAAVSAEPNLARAVGRLGVAYAKQQQFTQAVDHLRRYAELEPTSPHALTNLANVLLQLRRPDEAVALYRTALRYDPQYAGAHQSLIQALTLTHRTDQLIEALRAAHVALPDARPVTVRLAWLLATSSRDDLRDPPEALRLIKRALSAGSATVEDLAVLAAVQAALGDFDQAVETARRALSQTSDQASAQRFTKQLRFYEAGQPYRE